MNLFLLAAILGLIEGITEFLPISSTGHLILFNHLFGFTGEASKTFSIVIQLGAILAISVLYRQRLWQAATGMTKNRKDYLFVRNILIAFLPSMVIGVIAYPFIKKLFDTPVVIAVMLVLGGIAILFIEQRRHAPRHHAVEDFTPGLALKIGLFQVIAMIPGVSRSGATIMGSLLVGVERKTAAEFSFFLAIPTMLGATVYSLYKDWAILDFSDGGMIAVGFVSAFISALIVVKTAVAFIARHGFGVFAWYRIILGSGIMIALLATR